MHGRSAWSSRTGSSERAPGLELGFDDGNLYEHLRAEGFGSADIYRTGLVENRTAGPHGYLAGCVTIPYHVVNNVASIRGRSFTWRKGDKAPKYKTLAGDRARLFNTDATWHTEELFIAEGEFDCLILQQLGFNAVAVPGANTWQDAWDGYLSMVPKVFLLFDGDEAGLKGVQRLKDRFGPKVRALHIPEEDGEVPDISDWVVEYGRGAEHFQQLVDEAMGGTLLLTVSATRR